ncbi:YitT family protein [Allobaculum stercoricanis]|uniref:YitT family protein n=1 Tax=Allobaculum stercoricanis TaxID=174709 RepID=UPI0023F4C255|nr:YitT family protein [Allobaculum stercoricanis]
MSKVKNILLLLLGNLILACGTSFFILPNNILSGGVTAISIILDSLLGINRVFTIYALNIVLFILGAVCLGKAFAAKALMSTILYPTFIALLSPFYDPEFCAVDPILAAIFAGVIMGTGLGLVFRANGSSGGMDIPALILHKYLHIPQGNAVFIIDFLTVSAGLMVFGLNSLLTGILTIFTTSNVINMVLTFGGENAQNVMIISNKWETIRDYLLKDLARGVTILEGTGAYSNEHRPVLMCVVKTREYAKFQREIGTIDPEAFIIVNSVHEVRGMGFSYAVPNGENK